MCDAILVTSSEGCLSSSEDFTDTPEVHTLSSPWSLRYHFDKTTNNCGEIEERSNLSEKAFWNKEKIIGNSSQENECSGRTLQKTPIVARVPYRRLPGSNSQDTRKLRNESHNSSVSSAFSISKKSKRIKKKIPTKSPQKTRKILAELFEKQLTPESKLQPLPLEHDKDDGETFTPTASRSSSSTSVASSISPVTPLERYKKRFETKKVDKQASLAEPDIAEKYQKLLTKYFKTRKVVKMLKNQNKVDQKRIALLEFTRQRDAEIPDLSQESQRNIKQERQQSISVHTGDEVACFKDVEGAGGSAAEIRISNGIGNEVDVGPRDDVATYWKVKEEVTKRMAVKISDQALRPVVYNISLDSPPSKMNLFMDRLTKSKKLCESCGKKIKLKLND